MKKQKRRYPFFLFLLILIFLFSAVMPVFGYSETIYHTDNTASPITKGLTYESRSIFTASGWVELSILKVDLTEKYLDIVPLYNSAGLSTRTTVLKMAKQSGAIAAINADFFIMNATSSPIGALIKDGEVLSSPSNRTNMDTFVLDENNIPSIVNFTYKGTLRAANGLTSPIAAINKIMGGYTAIYMYTPAFGSKTPAASGQDNFTFATVKDNKVVSLTTGATAPIPADSIVLAAGNTGGQFLRSNLSVGSAVSITLDIAPDIDTLSLAIGGGATLIKNGVIPSSFSHEITGKSQRSAIGYSKDNKTLYLVTADGRETYTPGLTQKQFAELLKDLGIYNALNFDGGGSTTMVGRPLGQNEVTILNGVAENEQRSVSNAVGILSHAPAGSLSTIQIKADADNVVRKGKLGFSVIGYDTYYNPVTIDQSKVTYTITDGYGSFSGSTLTASKSGLPTVTAKYQGLSATKKIRVLGEGIKLTISPNEKSFNPNESYTFDVILTDSNGYEAALDPAAVTWTVINNVGSVKGGVFTAGTETKSGALIGTYGNAQGGVLISVGLHEVILDDFSSASGKTFSSYPAHVEGSFSIVGNGYPSVSSPKSGQLLYDFTGETATRATYINFTGGLKLPSGTQSLGFWAFGDNQGHWLRGVVTDANGKQTTIDFADLVDWQGFKFVETKLPSGKAPFTLNKIYLVEANAEVQNSGYFYIDDLTAFLSSDYDDSQLDSLNPPMDPRKKTVSSPAVSMVLLTSSDRISYANSSLVKSYFTGATKILTPSAFSTANSALKAKEMILSSSFNITSFSDFNIVTVNNSKGGIRLSGSTQWTRLNQLISDLKVKPKNLIVFLSASMDSFKDEKERALFEKTLGDYQDYSGKDVFVITRTGKNYDFKPLYGVNYINLGTLYEGYESIPIIQSRDGKLYYNVIRASDYKVVEVALNGEKMTFPDQNPILDAKDSRVLVPIRFIAEKLNASVGYNSADKVVTITKDGTNISLKIGENKATVNGKVITFDTKATIYNDRTMVPLRFVSEALNVMTEWNGKKNLVSLSSQ